MSAYICRHGVHVWRTAWNLARRHRLLRCIRHAGQCRYLAYERDLDPKRLTRIPHLVGISQKTQSSSPRLVSLLLLKECRYFDFVEEMVIKPLHEMLTMVISVQLMLICPIHAGQWAFHSSWLHLEGILVLHFGYKSGPTFKLREFNVYVHPRISTFFLTF